MNVRKCVHIFTPTQIMMANDSTLIIHLAFNVRFDSDLQVLIRLQYLLVKFDF